MTPFDYEKAINEKKPVDNVIGYNPYLTNISLSYALDGVLLANEMNFLHGLPPQGQFDFLFVHSRLEPKREQVTVMHSIDACIRFSRTGVCDNKDAQLPIYGCPSSDRPASSYPIKRQVSDPIMHWCGRRKWALSSCSKPLIKRHGSSKDTMRSFAKDCIALKTSW